MAAKPPKRMIDNQEVLDEGTLSFSVESRIIRELGERLVKKPDVALLELIKNAYDADSVVCRIKYEAPEKIVISDDGHGMTVDEFKAGWMRIGTSVKEDQKTSRRFGRFITGEKGIGRFAVRFLGQHLHLESVAYDKARDLRTLLVADFDWPAFDETDDISKIAIRSALLSSRAERGTSKSKRVGVIWPMLTTMGVRRRSAYDGAVTASPGGAAPI